MKTISIQAGRLAFPSAQFPGGGLMNMSAGAASPLRVQPRAWLPTPALPQTSAVKKPAKTLRGLWLPTETEPAGEKVLMGLLVAAGAGAIGYGFWCLVDLVQHWALFNGQVAQMIQ